MPCPAEPPKAPQNCTSLMYTEREWVHIRHCEIISKKSFCTDFFLAAPPGRMSITAWTNYDACGDFLHMRILLYLMQCKKIIRQCIKIS